MVTDDDYVTEERVNTRNVKCMVNSFRTYSLDDKCKINGEGVMPEMGDIENPC